MNTTQDISPKERAKWQIPAMETPLWLGKQHPYCVVIPVINEGERIKSLLKRMEAERISSIADIIIVDGGSTDGSLELDALKQVGVRGLVVKKGPGKLSAQLRCAYAFALDQGYKGIVTIDGNDKDDPEAIPRFIEALEGGIDFVQASRFLPGGVAVNTPKSRDFAIRYIHAPCLSVASGFKWTDTTQGFRAYSRRMLLDTQIAPFRNIFEGYELLAYLSSIGPRAGYRCAEVPSVRVYPEGEVPTKITGIWSLLSLFSVLLKACLSCYDVKSSSCNLRECFAKWMPYLFLLAVAFIAFDQNIFGFATKKWYDSFQKESEDLVLGSVAASVAGLDKRNAGLGKLSGAGYLVNLDSIYITDRNWVRGVGRGNNVFLAPNAPAYQAAYGVGTELKIGSAVRRIISVTNPSDKYMHVTVDGEELRRAADGLYPSDFLYRKQGSGQYRSAGVESVGKFGPYFSQYGLQGRFFSSLCKYGGVCNVDALRGISSGLAALAITALAAFYVRIFGVLYAGCFYAGMVASPWVVAFAPNLYWVEATWILPAITGAILYERYLTGKKILWASVFLAAAVALKSLCGYEYITTIILFSSMVFIVAPIIKKERLSLRREGFGFFYSSFLGCFGFLVALLVHARARSGSVFEGLKDIYERDVKRRTFGDPTSFDPVYAESLLASPMDVVKKYLLEFNTDFVLGLSGVSVRYALFAGCVLLPLGIIARSLDVFRPGVLLLVSAMPAISWYVLGKSHSYIHTHMNFVLWSYFLAPMVLYVLIDVLRSVVLAARDKAY